MVRSIAQRCVSNHVAPSFETRPSAASQDEAELKPMPMNVVYKGSADLPEIIPVFPLPGA